MDAVTYLLLVLLWARFDKFVKFVKSYQRHWHKRWAGLVGDLTNFANLSNLFTTLDANDGWGLLARFDKFYKFVKSKRPLRDNPRPRFPPIPMFLFVVCQGFQQAK